MDSIIAELLHDENKLMLVLVSGVFALWIVVGSFTKMVTSAARERTKREIAAYIAEGTMSPEQGERLLKAGKRDDNRCG